MLHQAKDEANSRSQDSDRDAQERDKSGKQAAVATPAVVPVQTEKPAVKAITGFASWAATAAKSTKSAGQTDQEAATAVADDKKSDATAILMQAIAGLGMPQIAPHPVLPAPVQRSANNQAGKGASVDVRATAPAITTSSVTNEADESLSITPGGSRKGANSGTSESMVAADTESQPAVSSGQLAFAARLNAEGSSAQQLQTAQTQPSRQQAAQTDAQSSAAAGGDAISTPSILTQAVQSGIGQIVEEAQKSEGQVPAAAAATPATSEPAAAPRAETVHAIDQPGDIRSADIDQAPAGANAAAVRDVRLQVAGADNQRVDVRVMDRGGELRVSVRADDPSLVRSLQDNVADLSTRLDQAHFRSEVWTPRTQAIEQTDSASTNGRTFSNGSGASEGDGRGQQQNGRQQQPAWVDDFDEGPTGQNSGSTPQWQQ